MSFFTTSLRFCRPQLSIPNTGSSNMAELQLRKKSAKVLGALQIVAGGLLFLAMAMQWVKCGRSDGLPSDGLPLAAASLFIICGSIGIRMAKQSKKCLVVTGLVLGVLCCLSALWLGEKARRSYDFDSDDFDWGCGWGCPSGPSGEFDCFLNVSGSLTWDQNNTCVYVGNGMCGPNPNQAHMVTPPCQAKEMIIMCAIGSRHQSGGHGAHKHVRMYMFGHMLLLLVAFITALGQVVVASMALCCKKSIGPQVNYDTQTDEKLPLPENGWIDMEQGRKAEQARREVEQVRG